MNVERYPWLQDLDSPQAVTAIRAARESFLSTGAAIFPEFLTSGALQQAAEDARRQEDGAFTTDDKHTAYLRPPNANLRGTNSVQNFEMRTQVASIAYDELSPDSPLCRVYRDEILRRLIALIVGKEQLFLSDDPLGACSINVFRPGYHHSFHFDESEFSTTLMLQEASNTDTGLFQYTNPLRESSDDLVEEEVANVLTTYDDTATGQEFQFQTGTNKNEKHNIPLHTLDFKPGTLSIFAGSKSLHRVTKVEGKKSRLVAVLTFASAPGFRNSPAVQKLFWGRSSE